MCNIRAGGFNLKNLRKSKWQLESSPKKVGMKIRRIPPILNFNDEKSSPSSLGSWGIEMGFVICSSSGPQNTPAMVSELLPGSLTVSLPLKIYPAPKEKETSLPTILFQGRTVHLGGVSVSSGYRRCSPRLHDDPPGSCWPTNQRKPTRKTNSTWVQIQ